MLGLTGVTRSGWIAAGALVVGLLAAIGALWLVNDGLRGDLSKAGEQIGELKAAHVQDGVTIDRQTAALGQMQEAVQTCNARVNALLADGKQRAVAARAQLAKVQGAADQNRRAADDLAEQIRLVNRAGVMRPGEPECMAAVRVIREHLQ
jgi:hypothetical protein